MGNAVAFGVSFAYINESLFFYVLVHLWFPRMLWRFPPEDIENKATIMHMCTCRDNTGRNDVMSFLCFVQSTMPQWNSFALGDDNCTCMDSCFAKKVMHMWLHRMLWRFLPEFIEIKATRMHMSKCKMNAEPHLLGLPFASCAASEPQLRGF